jgi:TetR/AcrR family transcriptional repressor of nem operon
MRYEKGHKDETRQRILEVASQQFRHGGLAATGIATIMSEAGLTNGAFYPHFASKDDLILETLASALAEQNERQKRFLESGDDLEDVIRSYLRKAHRDNASRDCPSAALLPEISRQPLAIRQAYQSGLESIIATLASHFPQERPHRARQKAMTIFSLLVGSLQIARAVPDAILADEILEEAVQGALRLAAGEGRERARHAAGAARRKRKKPTSKS